MNPHQSFGVYPAPDLSFLYQGDAFKGTQDSMFTKYTVTQPEHSIEMMVGKGSCEPYSWFITIPDDAL